MNWIVNEESAHKACPLHELDAKCIEVSKAEDDTSFKVKVHGNYFIGPKGGPLEYESISKACEGIDDLFATVAHPSTIPTPPKSVQPPPYLQVVWGTKAQPVPQPITQVEQQELSVKAAVYNMYQVMTQGTPFGTYVLVNSPRFGPLDPNSAINLACWLRKFAEQCDNVTVTFDEVWSLVNELP